MRSRTVLCRSGRERRVSGNGVGVFVTRLKWKELKGEEREGTSAMNADDLIVGQNYQSTSNLNFLHLIERI